MPGYIRPQAIGPDSRKPLGWRDHDNRHPSLPFTFRLGLRISVGRGSAN